MPGPTDTRPEIAAMLRERLMARSGAERFQMDCRMFEAAREMVLASLPTDLSQANFNGFFISGSTAKACRLETIKSA